MSQEETKRETYGLLGLAGSGGRTTLTDTEPGSGDLANLEGRRQKGKGKGSTG